MTNDNHSPELRRVLAIAAIEAEREQAGQVGVQHVICAFAMEGANVGASLLEQQGLTLADVRALDFSKKKEPLQ